MVYGLLAVVLLNSASPIGIVTAWTYPPALDISAIRQIRCPGWTGSGFIIGKGIMATANHVISMGMKGCFDAQTGSALIPYKSDVAHDLTLVTGKFPDDIPYIKYSCEPFKPGQPYLSYGITGYMQRHTIIRNNVLIATKDKTEKGFKFSDGMAVEGARIFTGYQAPGMSGGPIADVYGYAHGVVTGGSSYESFHYEFTDGMLCK